MYVIKDLFGVYVIKDLFGVLVTVSVLLNMYVNCKCRKKVVDKSGEECTENFDEVKIDGTALFEHENECYVLTQFVLSWP